MDPITKIKMEIITMLINIPIIFYNNSRDKWTLINNMEVADKVMYQEDNHICNKGMAVIIEEKKWLCNSTRKCRSNNI